MRISVTLLQYEHGILRQVLDVLAEVIKEDRAAAKRDDVKELLDFLYEFVDRFHHAKEEEFFFSVVLEQFPRFKEEVDGIYDDHVQARGMLEDAIKALDENDWTAMAESCRALVRHMTAHVELEEDYIFPPVDDSLPLEMDERINNGYQGFLRRFGDDYYQKAEVFSNEIQDRLLGPGFFTKGIY